MKPLFLLSLIAATMAPTHAMAAPDACPGLENGRIDEANRFYRARAIEIMRAGVKGDLPTLRNHVSPQAIFEVWQADSGSKGQGPQGVIDIARQYRPIGYSFWTDFPAMVMIAGAARCEWKVTIVLHFSETDGARMNFEFRDGVLIAARGQQGTISRGTF